MIRFKDAKSTLAQFAGSQGHRPDHPDVLFWLNEALTDLFEKGDWIGTIENIDVEPFGDVYSLPYAYKDARGASDCCGNEYSIIPPQDHSRFVGSQKFLLLKAEGIYYSINSECCCGVGQISSSDAESDQGAEIYIEYQDESSTLIKETLKLDLNPVTTKRSICFIKYLEKPKTRGNLLVYALTQDRTEKTLLSRFDAEFEHSFYTRFISKACREDQRNLSFRCKKRFIPLESDRDLIPIGNIPALQFAMQAYTEKRNGDNGAYHQAIASAVRILQEELANQTSENSNLTIQAQFGHRVTKPRNPRFV